MDCILCLLRQSLEAARFASSDTKIHQAVIQSGMEKVLQFGLETPPPVIGQQIHRIIRELTNNPDPYAKEKKRFNIAMLEQYDALKKRIQEAGDSFDTAVRIAIAGNIIDFALGSLDQNHVNDVIEKAIHQPINGSMNDLKEAVQKAETIFYLADNSGEIVCDRLMIELLLSEPYRKKIVLGVRGKPVINDATAQDAEFVGLSKIVSVIDNGNDGLGIMLEQCCPEFLDHFQNADLIIAKGLANYETLIENNSDIKPKKIAFLFKAKCPFISDYASAKLGDLVIRIV